MVHFGDYELINTSSRQAKVGTLQNQYCSFIQSSQWNLNWSIQDSRFTQYALFGSLSLLKKHVLCFSPPCVVFFHSLSKRCSCRRLPRSDLRKNTGETAPQEASCIGKRNLARSTTSSEGHNPTKNDILGRPFGSTSRTKITDPPAFRW